jgi:hypothetical protein
MWGLPVIWQRTGTGNIRPLCLLLPVGLYGKITTYLREPQSITTARRIHSGFFIVHVGYVSGRKTILWGSLGSGRNVCTMPCHFSAAVRRITPFSFVAVTLYILATLAFVPMEGDESGNHIGLVYFYYIATPWYKYVLSASMQNVL